MSGKRTRRPFTSEQKADILRRHMVDKVPMSELCNELGLQPSVFYQWQRQAMENLASALSGPAAAGPSTREKELGRKVAQLEKRLTKKDGVIAEISAEYVKLKKEVSVYRLNSSETEAGCVRARTAITIPSAARLRAV